MSWYRETGYAWTARASVSVDNTAGAGGSVNVSIDLSQLGSDFWDAIDTDGDELRVVLSDGKTKATYDITGWSKSARTGTARVTYTAPAAAICTLWIYWGATGASSGAGSPTTTSPLTGYVETCLPPVVVRAEANPAASAKPRNRVLKCSAETLRIAVDVGPLLPLRLIASDGHRECDEVSYVTYTVTTAQSGAQAGMVTAANTRLVRGRYVILELKAGSDGSDYTVCPVIRAGSGLVLAPRILLTVRDQDEA